MLMFRTPDEPLLPDMLLLKFDFPYLDKREIRLRKCHVSILNGF